jgi:hypothetical protein
VVRSDTVERNGPKITEDVRFKSLAGPGRSTGADQGHRQASEQDRHREEAASSKERARHQRTMANVDRSGRCIGAICDLVAEGPESEFAPTPAEVSSGSGLARQR